MHVQHGIGAPRREEGISHQAAAAVLESTCCRRREVDVGAAHAAGGGHHRRRDGARQNGAAGRLPGGPAPRRPLPPVPHRLSRNRAAPGANLVFHIGCLFIVWSYLSHWLIHLLLVEMSYATVQLCEWPMLRPMTSEQSSAQIVPSCIAANPFSVYIRSTVAAGAAGVVPALPRRHPA